MDVTASMMEFVLRKHGFDARVSGAPETIVRRITAFRGARLEPGTLYVANGQLPAEKALMESRSVALVVKSQPTAAPDGRAQEPSPLQAFELASNALHELDSWDAKLKEALLQSVSLAEYMRIGSEMFTCPIAYFDRNLITLAATEGYWDRSGTSDGQNTDVARPSDQMPPSLAVDLVEDFDYLHAAEHHEPFYYTSTQGRVFYGANTFSGDEYLARLVFSLPEESTRLHPGEEALVAHYHDHLNRLYLHYAGNANVVSTQNDSLHTLARSILVDGNEHGSGEMASILDAFGWSDDDCFIVVKLVFFEGVHWDSISLYLCGLFERLMPMSCAFPIDQQIAWLVNLSRSAYSGESSEGCIDRLVKSLVEVMRDYACKAGISDAFLPLAEARSFYLEATRALEIGQARDPHRWYYRFSDYAFDCLLEGDIRDFSPQQLCHPALAKLIACDRERGTDFARTLICYLRCSQNTTRTAEELFIHRTSFMRRLSSMRNLVDLDLDDPDEVLHLLLSAKLLDL